MKSTKTANDGKVQQAVCFYCCKPIDIFKRPYMRALIARHFKNGNTRESERNFHSPCFRKLFMEVARRSQPNTKYAIKWCEVMHGNDTDVQFLQKFWPRFKFKKHNRMMIGEMLAERDRRGQVSTRKAFQSGDLLLE